MDLAAIDVDCRLLGEALRDRTRVPRDRRKEARVLLRQAFLLRGEPGTEPAAMGLAALSPIAEALDALLIELKIKEAPVEWEPLAFRLAEMWPVRMRFAVRQSLLERFEQTYFEHFDRMTEVVDWFWARCEPDAEVMRERTIAEKALAEFVGEDREFVWGRRKRVPPRRE